jgi:biopolymer transport protein ExbD
MSDKSLAEPQMNATPLIDVLLVLLVMLIFTLPIATHAIKLNLPHGGLGTPLPLVTVNVESTGDLYWNGEPIGSLADVERRFRGIAGAGNQTRVKVLPDERTRYENVARVLAAAQRAGVTRLEVGGS